MFSFSGMFLIDYCIFCSFKSAYVRNVSSVEDCYDSEDSELSGRCSFGPLELRDNNGRLCPLRTPVDAAQRAQHGTYLD